LISYGFIFRVRQLRRCFGFDRTLPSVRAITHVGTDCDSLPALANRSFFAVGFTLAIVYILLIVVSRFLD
jgi:hypothetical protein